MCRAAQGTVFDRTEREREAETTGESPRNSVARESRLRGGYVRRRLVRARGEREEKGRAERASVRPARVPPPPTHTHKSTHAPAKSQAWFLRARARVCVCVCVVCARGTGGDRGEGRVPRWSIRE